MDIPPVPSSYNVQDMQAAEEAQRRFLTRVYAWMTFGLVCTAAAAFITIYTPGLLMSIMSTPLLFLGLMFGELALVLVLSAAINRLAPVAAGLLFVAYALLNGVTLSILVLVYTSTSIALTFGITASMFGIMTLYGLTTQRDLTRLGSLLFMGLIGLVLAMLANLFLRTDALYWLITIVGILIFIGLVAYDTQKLKNMSLVVDAEGQVAQKASVLGALALYLDFINLFLLLLRLLGRRR